MVEKFKARGEVIGIGPVRGSRQHGDFSGRARPREAFAKEDPFILEGLVKSFTIRDWNDTMLE